MFRDKQRYGQNPNVVVRSKTLFNAPLKLKDPSMIFTCSWSDWLIEEADPWREEAYDVIRATPQHTYQILTKRIDRAANRIPNPPLPNVWLGVSVENQEYADKRIPLLLHAPAAVRFISAEPLLGPVNLVEIREQLAANSWRTFSALEEVDSLNLGKPRQRLDWVIAGAESGPDARPMQQEWVRFLRDQCLAAGVKFFYKQDARNGYKIPTPELDGRKWVEMPDRGLLA